MNSEQNINRMIWNAEVFLAAHRQMSETDLAMMILADPDYSKRLQNAEELVKFNNARQAALRRIDDV